MLKIFLFLSLFVSTQANANWLLEPSLGFEQGQLSVEDINTIGVKTNYSESTTILGVKFAYIFQNRISFGGEASLISNSEFSSGQSNLEFSQKTLFAQMSYENNRWRYGLSYGFEHRLNLTSNLAEQIIIGNTLKVSFGYMVFNYVSLNLEYSTHQYSDVEIAGVKTDLAKLYRAFDHASYNLNLSFPYIF